MTNRFKRTVAAARRRIGVAFSVLCGSSYFYSKRIYIHHQLSFSQEGEDRVLMRLFERQSRGFYVDVGAHHPQRFSNTYCFYRRGWTGINIDPLPGSKAKFDQLRPLDINLEMGVATSAGELTYYSFEEPALNTFDSEVASSQTSKLLDKVRLKVAPLRDVLDRYLPAGVSIDFLSIDVEGLDLDVLHSNDWSRFRPKFVLAEALAMRDIRHVQSSELHAYMESVGYSFFAKTMNTLFFVDLAS